MVSPAGVRQIEDVKGKYCGLSSKGLCSRILVFRVMAPRFYAI